MGSTESSARSHGLTRIYHVIPHNGEFKFQILLNSWQLAPAAKDRMDNTTNKTPPTSSKRPKVQFNPLKQCKHSIWGVGFGYINIPQRQSCTGGHNTQRSQYATVWRRNTRPMPVQKAKAQERKTQITTRPAKGQYNIQTDYKQSCPLKTHIWII